MAARCQQIAKGICLALQQHCDRKNVGVSPLPTHRPLCLAAFQGGIHVNVSDQPEGICCVRFVLRFILLMGEFLNSLSLLPRNSSVGTLGGAALHPSAVFLNLRFTSRSASAADHPNCSPAMWLP